MSKQIDTKKKKGLSNLYIIVLYIINWTFLFGSFCFWFVYYQQIWEIEESISKTVKNKWLKSSDSVGHVVRTIPIEFSGFVNSGQKNSIEEKKTELSVYSIDYKNLISKLDKETQKKIEEQTLLSQKQEQIALRRRNFIKKHWKLDFWNIELWYVASQWQNVDVDVGICIGFAESWLGRALTTRNNVWNIWNNDRWDRKEYETPIAGMRWIFYALNNRFLWKYFMISQLSRYWNPKWAIYASSPKNWHKNVTKCLSEIKWYQVSDNFIYRLDMNYPVYDINIDIKDMDIEDWTYGDENINISMDSGIYWLSDNNKFVSDLWKYWWVDINIWYEKVY